MALQRYSDTYWYPSGQLAGNVAANVFPLNSNVPAPLFADGAGTIPLPNPTRTSATGVLTFWAEAGEHWVFIRNQAFQVPVGLSQEQADLSTGTANGGNISVNLTNPKALDIEPLVGYVVNQPLSGATPSLVMVKSPQRTEALTPASEGRILTWWLMDALGVVSQQGTFPTPSQIRFNLVLGMTAYDGGSGSIVFHQNIPITLNQPIAASAVLMDSLGPFSISGNSVDPLAGTMSFAKTAGTIFARGFNFVNNTNEPNIANSPGQNPAQFAYITQNAFSTGPLVTSVDAGQYDVGGVVTPVPAPNLWTIQRVWCLPVDDAIQLQIRVQYGQNTYASQAEAINAIGNTDFVPQYDSSTFGCLLAHIVVRADATDLNDPTQADVQRAGKFSAP